MKFVGIDPSLTSTGLIVLNDKGLIEIQRLIKTKPDKEIEDRLSYLSSEILRILSAMQYDSFLQNAARFQAGSVPIIHIEGLSFGARGQGIMQLAGLHFILRTQMKANGFSYKVIAPTELKKYVTGKGNAQKQVMLMKTLKRWNVEFESDDLCDAFGLAKMAYETHTIFTPESQPQSL